ncbi:MAG: hypothetical protein ABI548_29005 [Polyangiaceae bacterium]
MTDNQTSPRFLVGTILHELADDADAVFTIAKALEDQASGTGSGAAPQKLREMAALVKSAALALCMAAANLVGVTERLTIVAAFAEIDEAGGGDLPS